MNRKQFGRPAVLLTAMLALTLVAGVTNAGMGAKGPGPQVAFIAGPGKVALPPAAAAALKARIVDPTLICREDIAPVDDMSAPGGASILDWSDKDPTGTNTCDFSQCWYGDILLVHDGFCYGYYRHTGMWDADYDCSHWGGSTGTGGG